MANEQLSLRSEMRIWNMSAGARIVDGLIPYNSRSADLGNFTEQIAPGAFRDALRPDADILALRDHDPKIVLGRTKSKTLSLSDSPDGLRYSIELPNTTQANDLAESIRRGDVNSCSFGFTTPSGGDTWERDANGKALRTLKTVELFEISCVSFPAYASSSVAMRSCPPDLLLLISEGAHLKDDTTDQWRIKALMRLRLAQAKQLTR